MGKVVASKPTLAWASVAMVLAIALAAWSSSPFLIKAMSVAGRTHSRDSSSSSSSTATAAAVSPEVFTGMIGKAKAWTKHFEFNLASSMSTKSVTGVWGSLRPYTYFGMKSRTVPFSLATGLMWFGARGVHEGMRHDTVQGQLTKFEWLEHDGRTFGLEKLLDRENRLEINASFAIPTDLAASEESSGTTPPVIWSQRIVAVPLPPADGDTTGTETQQPLLENSNLVFYFGLEGSDLSPAGIGHMIDSTKIRLKVVTHTNSGGALTLLGVSSTFGSFSVSATARLVAAGFQSCAAGSSSATGVDASASASASANLFYSTYAATDVTGGTKRFERELQNRATVSSSDPTAAASMHQRQLSQNSVELDASFIALHASAPGTQPLVLDVVMRRHGSDSLETMALWAASETHLVAQSELVTSLMEARSSAFHDKFEKTLGLAAKIPPLYAVPLLEQSGQSGPAAEFSAADVSAAKAALSSLLGGMGFFYGTPRIGDALNVDESATGVGDADVDVADGDRLGGGVADPIALLSATPSRTAFPRGFLWDEGFHQMIVAHWDARLSTEVLSHWLDAMYRCDRGKTPPNADTASRSCTGGWIPREMILGDAATKRVPDEFVTQRVNIANPPTLLLAVDAMVERFGLSHPSGVSAHNDDNGIDQDERDAILSFLSDALPALHEWVQWFLASQQGVGGAFRWRGRSTSDQKLVPNTLASGLDDYPRGPLPHESERHLDLHCWMVMACKTMARLQHVVEANTKTTPVKFDYAAKATSLLAALDELHWSEQMQTYVDVGVSGSQDALRSEVMFRCGHPSDPRAMVDVSVPVEVLKSGAKFCPESHPKPLFPHGDGRGGMHVRERYVIGGELSLQYIPRLGYVNLFPLLLRLIAPDSPKLASLLTLLQGPQLLWSDHGLRSLATTDPFYRRNNAPGDAPYWRGPIWININFLALGALKHYSLQPGPEQTRCTQLYHALRANVLKTVLGEYHRTGFLWEQFDDKEGVGIRGHPFSGWTALVVNIMAERY